ncbi:MAG TPA: hypothetical protein VNJ01_12565 [Bacteriovoracaceae bacterium]|nr:hypothetical protein [Bacteriovoracaceae bacterium]
MKTFIALFIIFTQLAQAAEINFDLRKMSRFLSSVKGLHSIPDLPPDFTTQTPTVLKKKVPAWLQALDEYRWSHE